MLGRIQEGYYFFLASAEAAGITLNQARRTFHDRVDILLAVADLVFNLDLLKNKFYAILLILCTLPVALLDGDASTTVFMAFIAIPMFFSKKSWIL